MCTKICWTAFFLAACVIPFAVCPVRALAQEPSESGRLDAMAQPDDPSERAALAQLQAALGTSERMKSLQHFVVGTRPRKQREAENPSELTRYLIAARVVYATSKDFGLVRAFPQLEHVKADGTFGDGAMSALENLHELQTLRLSSTQLTDDGVEAIASLKKLRKLDLAYTSVTGACLPHLLNLIELRELYLPYRSVSDGDLKGLPALSKLETLSLPDSPVSDRGLEYISQIKSLKHLMIPGSLISDQGLLDLVNLPNLRYLHLDGVAVSEVAVKEFRRARPDVLLWGK